MISIGFFSNNSTFCHLIQLVSGGEVNHAAIGLIKYFWKTYVVTG